MLTHEPLIDDAAIERLRGFGGPKLVRGMIELFIKTAPAKVSAARQALDAGDPAALRAALHALKSSAGQLGAATVFQACKSGEEQAGRGDLAACAPLVARIETDLPAACRQLEALQAST